MEQVASVDEHQTIDDEEIPFPVDALPEPMRDFVEQSAAALSAAPDLVALPALVAAGAAIGNSVLIRAKHGWTESAAIYGAVIADSGSRKSPAQAHAMAPITSHSVRTSRTWTSDVTVERLAELLDQNPRGVAIIRDELCGWVKSLNQYKGGKGADRAFFLSAWFGQAHRVDRKCGTELFLPRPFVSVIGGIPPMVLSDIASREVYGDGFLERLLFVYPEPVPVRLTKDI